MQGAAEVERREKKRMQAIYELLESEREYTYDMVLWTRTFRHLVVNTPNLTLFSKQMFISKVLMNSQVILAIHTEILDELRWAFKIKRGIAKEEFLKREISEDNVEKICKACTKRKDAILREYVLYATTVPKATEDMEKILEESESFSAEVVDVLKRMNRLHLGYLHFLMRPMQKIARYSLLLLAIRKHAREKEKKVVEETAAVFGKISSEVNHNVEYSSNYFALYHLSKIMNVEKSARKFAIGLMQKERRLIRMEDGVQLVLDGGRKPVSVVVLDNCVFLLESQIRGEYLLISAYKKRLFNDFMPIEDVLVEKMSEKEQKGLYQLRIQDRKCVYIVECADWVCDGLYQDITSAVSARRKEFFRCAVERIELGEGREKVSLALLETRGGRGQERSSGEGEKKTDSERKDSSCENGYENNTRTNGQRSDAFTLASLGTVLIGSKRGLEMVANERTVQVLEKEAYEIEFVSDLSSVVFKRGNRLYYTNITNGVAENRERSLTGKVAVSFLERTRVEENESEENFLIIKQVGYLGTEELLIIKLTRESKSITQSLYRRMYMAGDISSVSFFGNHFAIASNDFELIDLKDLTTQELLDPLDKTINLFVDKARSKPISIHKTEENRYLIVFDDLGLFINRFGSRRKAHILFLWLMYVVKVVVFQEYVVAVGEELVKIFTLADGVLRCVIEISNGKVLRHPELLLIYNNEYLYRISVFAG